MGSFWTPLPREPGLFDGLRRTRRQASDLGFDHSLRLRDSAAVQRRLRQDLDQSGELSGEIPRRVPTGAETNLANRSRARPGARADVLRGGTRGVVPVR